LASPHKPARQSPFSRLGSFVYRRRKYVIVLWVVALVLVVPVISQEGKVTSLQLGTSTGSQLESVQASNLISQQFARTVPNSTLLIVLTVQNVSSASTQQFIGQLVHSLKGDNGISGLNYTVDVYSPLYSTIKSVNQAAYSAEKGANSSTRLLLGVPALYLGFWEGAYSSTHNLTLADSRALNYSASTLDSANATAYGLYSSHILSLFNTYWVESWSNPLLSNLTIVPRASLAAGEADSLYIDSYLSSSKAFDTQVLEAVTLTDFLADSPSQASARLSTFAVAYVSNSTGFSQTFVNSTFALGRTYNNASLDALAGNIVWTPSAYNVGRTISTLLSSLVSPGRNTTLVTLGLNVSSNSNVVAVRSDVASIVSASGGASGVQSALVTGEDAISYDFGNSAIADLGLILPVTIALLIVATGLFFRSVLTPFMTLGTIGVALGISQVFIVLVGTYIAKVDFTIPTILLTVIIGVGTDYSVFVIARYREERVKGATVQTAVETSVTWAGESIATSGATVIISFLALAFTSVVFLRTMGFVVGLGVLVALSIALTMSPALVGLVGERTFWPNSGARFEKYSAAVLSKLQRRKGYFSRSGVFAVKRAKVLIALAMIATGPALYVYATTTPTFDFNSAAPSTLTSIVASNHLTSAFGAGEIFPTYVVATFEQPLVVGHSFNATEMSAVESMSALLAASPDIRNVTGPTMPYGVPVGYGALNYSTSPGKQTFNAITQDIGKDNRTVLITINFGIDPYSTQAISEAKSMRQSLHADYGSAQGVTGVYLGGASGSILDTKNVFDSQFNSIVPIVAVGVALVLLAVLGSLFLPVFAVLSVLMSIVWTLAATKLVFQQFFNYQILFITPFFLFVTLLGLGMDYNIFILTRVREEATKGKHLNDAIIGAIEQTGAVITAAAIILAGSLGSLMLSSDLLLKQIGFSFAYSILIDALVVRTYLVPAVMSVVGKWNWYSPIPFLNRSKALFEMETPAATS
jgi:putative drug exporter of the RND superfamily